jgi:hypothetical protein
MIYMASGILIGLGFAAFMAFALFLQGYEPKTYIITSLVVGLIFCSLGGLIGHWIDADEKINTTIKTTINANYDDVVNFHNGITNQSFVSDGSKYTFDYDEETKTLTVFTDTNSNVDAVFVNGVKQDNQKTSDKTDKKKDCVSYKTDDADKTDADKINSKPDTTSSSSSTISSTAVSLQQKIQDKIQSRYNGAVITGFDTIKISGTFSCDNVQYNFQWKDDTLEVINADDADDVTYYKVVQ